MQLGFVQSVFKQCTSRCSSTSQLIRLECSEVDATKIHRGKDFHQSRNTWRKKEIGRCRVIKCTSRFGSWCLCKSVAKLLDRRCVFTAAVAECESNLSDCGRHHYAHVADNSLPMYSQVVLQRTLGLCALGLFRSTSKSRPNNIRGEKNVRTYVRPSVHKKFLRFQWNLVYR